jgi:hypothetical protein
MTQEKRAEEVKDRHSLELLSRPGISGVGVEQDDSGRYVLTIHLETDDPEVRGQLPAQIEGFPTRVVHSGPFHKF